MPRYKGPPPVADPDTFGPGSVLDVYLRASPGRKQEKSTGEQLAEIKGFFAQRGWTIGEVYCDDDRSGADAGREDMSRLLEKYAAGAFAPSRGVVIWSYSRLSREGSISFKILAVTRAAGVPLVPVADKVPHELRDFMEPFYFMAAQQQLQKTREDTARGMAEMIRKGYAPGGFPPLGYKVEHVQVGEHRDHTPVIWPRWVKDPETREVTARAWEMKLQGSSYQVILASTGLAMARNSLTTLFRNPCYAGFPNWYMNHYELNILDCLDRAPIVEPYVTVPEFLRAQEHAGTLNPRAEFGGWPLLGMLFCGYCGASVAAMAYSRGRHCDVCGEAWTRATPICPNCGADYSHRDGMHRYLCCNHQRNAANCSDSRYTGGRMLDLALINAVLPHLTAARLREQIRSVNEALAALHQAAGQERGQAEQALQVCEKEAAHLVEAIARGGASDLLLSTLSEKEEEGRRLRTLLATLPRQEAAPYVAEEEAGAIADLLQEKVPTMRRLELRQFFQSLGLKARLYNDRAEATIDWPPLRLLLPVHYPSYPQADSNRRSTP